MKLELTRTTYTDTSTIGELTIDGEHECFVLEDTVRRPDVKVYGKTAIPSGAYNVLLTFSPKFGRVMPLLDKVPNYEGVRIHKGNDANDTEGCLLVGRTYTDNFVGESALAFNALYPKIEAALKAGEHVTVVITDTYAEPPTDSAPAVSRKRAAK
jgi:hypothetical protein